MVGIKDAVDIYSAQVCMLEVKSWDATGGQLVKRFIGDFDAAQQMLLHANLSELETKNSDKSEIREEQTGRCVKNRPEAARGRPEVAWDRQQVAKN